MMRRPLGDKTRLRGAATTIFALTAILPLCVLVMFPWRSGALDQASGALVIRKG